MTKQSRETSTIPSKRNTGFNEDPEKHGSGRDPEERATNCREDVREKMLDKTLADSFPSSDPPSSIPNPCEDDSMAA
jgi:hypothetical protein